MSKVSANELIESLQWRYATKRFDPEKKIGDDDWNVLKETLRLSPSSYGLQPWKFIVVQNPELRNTLKAASWNQTQVTDCSHFVVLTYKTKVDEAYIADFIQNAAKVRNVDVATMNAYQAMMTGDLVKGPRSKIIEFWAQRQCYIALGFLLETAALLRIDACPMEGLDAMEYDKHLKLEGTGYATVCAAALGYRHPEDKYSSLAKVRFESETIVEVR